MLYMNYRITYYQESIIEEGLTYCIKNESMYVIKKPSWSPIKGTVE